MVVLSETAANGDAQNEKFVEVSVLCCSSSSLAGIGQNDDVHPHNKKDAVVGGFLTVIEEEERKVGKNKQSEKRKEFKDSFHLPTCD